ncbi:serine hydrolase domain-containing protein [Microbacterium terricola]|uniref:Serine hydrolase n=1 Tax=Microbacterium terricola TaxID=344163 RepID=A0ABM8E3I8_9MICO|nr:serine hydrolase domain-containing protein [Microbacterium terricola]UYK40027.1 beta-lactamase family protein [Microbacterium terricola]BDV32281.1 serine hydrolase [Microbacterium terricola]
MTALDGPVDDRFEPVQRLFASYLEADPAYSAQLAIWHRGRLVVDLAGGAALRRDSLTGVFSVTKGVAGLVMATLIATGELDLALPVAQYWPEFASRGKDAITVGDLLAHRAGLPALAGGTFGLDEILEASDRGAARLARQAPIWTPGSAFGYHALTIGILMEELVRRVTGRTLQAVYEQDIRAPRNADFFLGLPAGEESRYVPLAPAILSAEQEREVAARPPIDALASAVFNNVDAPEDLSERGTSTNNPRVRRAGPSAIGGVGSARGLATLYADALPSAQRPLASADVFADMATQRSWGQDRVLDVPNCFGAVFLLPQPRMPYGGLGAFGHDGAAGALAFADPKADLAFGYIPWPRQHPGGADYRSVQLARAAAECAHES